MRNIIVAYDHECAIGAKGDLLWQPGEMRADMKHFRDTTMGSAMIMGRKTLDSIGIALPGRETIVCSRTNTCDIPGIQTARSLEEAYKLTEDYEEVFVVGGGEVYRQAINDVNRIYATVVHASIPGADTFFPILDQSWQITDRQSFPADQNNKYPYSFVTFERDKR